jgi:hypothetical protein
MVLIHLFLICVFGTDPYQRWQQGSNALDNWLKYIKFSPKQCDFTVSLSFKSVEMVGN